MRPIALYHVNGPEFFSGQYRYEVAIELPPARNGLVPELRLSYSHTTDHTAIGRGWDFNLSHIRRSLSQGLPTYVGPGELANEDTFEFVIGPNAGRLVPIGTVAGDASYRAEVEGSFLRFRYQEQDNAWQVRDQAGKIWTLGGPGAVEGPGDAGHSFAWYVKSVEDAEGNRIEYDYLLQDNLLYLRGIRYDLHEAVNDAMSPSVVLNWEPAGHASGADGAQSHVSYKRGYRTAYGVLELSDIHVVAFNEKAVPMSRRYDFGHRAVPFGGLNVHSITPELLPKTSFHYNSYPTDFVSATPLEDGYASGHLAGRMEQWSLRTTRSSRRKDVQSGIPENDGKLQTSRTTNMLVDVDGDGDLDQLAVWSPEDYGDVEAASTWYWRENIKAEAWSPYREVTLPARETWDATEFGGFHAAGLERTVQKLIDFDFTLMFARKILATKRQGVVDMNRDGKADIVFVSSRGVHVCLNNTTDLENERRAGFDPCRVWLTGERLYLTRSFQVFSKHHTKKWTDVGLLDLNGDGRPDYVYTQASSDRSRTLVKAILNTGMGFAATDWQEHAPYVVEGPICDEVADAAQAFSGGTGAPACLSSSKNWSPHDESNPEWHPLGCVTRQMLDMNGDGVLDLMRNNPRPHTCTPSAGGLRLLTGVGHAFQASEFSLDALQGEDILTSYTHCADICDDSTLSGFYDVDGNGYPDYVLHGGDTGTDFTVRLNTGQGFSPRRVWGAKAPLTTAVEGYHAPGGLNYVASMAMEHPGLAASPNQRSMSVTQRGFADFDGDGHLEFLAVLNWSLSNCSPYLHEEDLPLNNPWLIHRIAEPGAGFAAGLLGKVESESGGKTLVRYAAVTDQPMPLPKTVVSQIMRSDANTSLITSEHIGYSGAKYDHRDGVFRGFHITDLNSCEQGAEEGAVKYCTRKDTSWFLQGRYDAGRRERHETLGLEVCAARTPGCTPAGTAFTLKRVSTTEYASVTLKSSPTDASLRSVWVRPRTSTRITDPSAENPGHLTTEYTYYDTNDGDGNRCSTRFDEIYVVDGQTRRYTIDTAMYQWTGDGRLGAAVYAKSGREARWEYDHAGRRWKETANGKTIYYLDEIAEFNEEAQRLDKHLHMPGITCTIRGMESAICYHKDLTNVRLADGGTGTSLVNPIMYMPYGRRVANRVVPPRFGYSGKQESATTELLYFNARYYDPVSRQFLSVDPARMRGVTDAALMPTAIQPFVYAASNPVTFTDPTGEVICGGACIFGAIVAAALVFETLVDLVNVGIAVVSVENDPSGTNVAGLAGAVGDAISGPNPVGELNSA